MFYNNNFLMYCYLIIFYAFLLKAVACTAIHQGDVKPVESENENMAPPLPNATG